MANPPVTPADSPSDPAGYASVNVQPANIQAPQEDLTAGFDAANRLTGAGVLYPVSERQRETEMLLASPPGYQDFDIYGGFSGQGNTTHGWPNDAGPSDGD